MKPSTLIGHTKGLRISKQDAAEGQEVLAGEDIVAVAYNPQDEDRIVAGSYGRGLFRPFQIGRRRREVDVH